MDGGGGSRAEAERWLYTANKLLSARDLHGARSFAIRARESDPTFDASELLLTVIDALVAGEARINDQRDWYGILQVLRYTPNIDHIAAQYRRLALLLDPHRNPFAFSSHAFTLVHDAWSVLSNPAKKAMYDSELRLVTAPPPPPAPTPTPPQRQQQHQNPPQGRRTPRSERPSPAEPTRQTRARESTRTPSETEGPSFWTACPYCYALFEYPKVYEECTLRCQSCRRGFHAVVIRSPPLTEKDSSFCSWGFFPLGFSGNFKDINGTSSNWNPFSPLFPCPLKGSSNRRSQKGWVYYDDDAAAAFVELSDPSEDDSDDGDWQRSPRRGRKRTRNTRRKESAAAGSDGRAALVDRPRRGSHGGAGHANVDNGEAVDGGGGGGGGGSAVPNAARAESSKKAASAGSRRRGAANLGKLDLNVEFSNDGEEPARGAREGNGTGNAEDNVEGIGLFEGLDEFLSSWPILNVVADDKVKGQ